MVDFFTEAFGAPTVVTTKRGLKKAKPLDFFTEAFVLPSTPTLPGEEAPPTIQEVERPAAELVFGIFPTINVGNILGIDNDVGRLVANILLDPIGLALLFTTGGLTAAGTAAKVARVLSTSRTLKVTKGLVELEKGATAANRIKNVQKNMSFLLKVDKLDTATKTAVKAAIETDDVVTFTKLARQIQKTKLTSKQAAVLPSISELFLLDDLVKAEKTFIASGGLSVELKRLVTETDALATTLGGQAAKVISTTAGAKTQRDFLRLKIPFIAGEKTLITGEPLWNSFGQHFALSPLLDPRTAALAAKIGIEANDLKQFMGGYLSNLGATIQGTVVAEKALKARRISRLTRILGDKMPVEQFDRLLPLIRERKGFATSTLQELGILEDVLKIPGVNIKSSVFRTAGGKVQKGIDIISNRDMNKFFASKGLTSVVRGVDIQVGKYFEKMRLLLNESDLGKDIPTVQSYVSHLWDINPEESLKVATRLVSQGFMTKKRKFANFIEGMNNKFKLRFDTMTDIMEQYAIQSNRIIAQKNLLQTFTGIKSLIKINGVTTRLMESKAVLQKLDVLDMYDEITDPRILKLMGINVQPVVKVSGEIVRRDLSKIRKWVPKQMTKGLDVAFGSKWNNAMAQSLDNFNAVSKVMALSFSFFHSAALIESSIATLGFRKGLTTAAKLGFGLPGARNALLKAGVGRDLVALTDDALVDAIRHGLAVATPSDAPVQLYGQVMDSITKKFNRLLPGTGILPKGLRFIQEGLNKGLWDNFHHPMKLIAYKDRFRFLKDLNPNLADDILKRRAASFVNNAFGGQNLNALLIHPKMQQALHWALLAPDWTISNLRIAGIGTSGLKGAARGIIGQGRNPTEELVGAYWRTAIPMFAVSTALLNRSLSGKWSWENDPGHIADINLGTKDDKGRTEYFKIGKQFREPLRWFYEPAKIFGAKLSPGIQTVVEQFTKTSTTGFPTEFAERRGQIPMTFVESLPKRLKSVVTKFVPFSIGGRSVLFAFPKSTFKEKDAAIALSSVIRGVKGRGSDPAEVRDILRLAQAANLNVGTIKSIVRRSVGDPRGLLSQNLETEGLGF